MLVAVVLNPPSVTQIARLREKAPIATVVLLLEPFFLSQSRTPMDCLGVCK